jgi:chromate transporter
LSIAPAPSFGEAVRAWTRVAIQSFGGPAGQIGVIHRVVVEEKRWVSEPTFLHALSYCMLLPGPEAQQLVTYFGWLLHGTRGALTAGTLFILPGVLAILALSVLYVLAGATPLVAGIFAGLKPAVLAVVVVAVGRLGSRALKGGPGIVLATLAFLGLYVFAVPFPLVLLAAGVTGLAIRPAPGAARPRMPGGRPSLVRLTGVVSAGLVIWAVPLLILLLLGQSDHVLATEARFFSKVAVVTFGGAYAVLSYVAQQAVEVHQWLSPAEMLDGLGLAETTPGPLIMVVQFVGFLGAWRSPGELNPMLAGVLGSLVTTWVTFVPSFIFIVGGAPWVEFVSAHRRLQTVLGAIMAAVVGVVINLAVWFGLHTLFAGTATLPAGPVSVLTPDLDTIRWSAVGILLLSLVALIRYRLNLGLVLAGASVAGIILHHP